MWIEFGMKLNLFSLMLNISRLINIQKREPNLRNVRKVLELACFQTLWTHFFQIFDMMIETTALYFFIPVRMTLTFIQGHSKMRNQKFLCSFSHKFLNWFG